MAMGVQGASKLNMNPPKPVQPAEGVARQVVYMPACVTRMMGPARGDDQTASVHEKLLSLFQKAGYEVIYPEVPPNTHLTAPPMLTQPSSLYAGGCCSPIHCEFCSGIGY